MKKREEFKSHFPNLLLAFARCAIAGLALGVSLEYTYYRSVALDFYVNYHHIFVHNVEYDNTVYFDSYAYIRRGTSIKYIDTAVCTPKNQEGSSLGTKYIPQVWLLKNHNGTEISEAERWHFKVNLPSQSRCNVVSTQEIIFPYGITRFLPTITTSIFETH